MQVILRDLDGEERTVTTLAVGYRYGVLFQVSSGTWYVTWYVRRGRRPIYVEAHTEPY